MSEQVLFDRIVISRDVVHGKPRVANTRIMVYQVLDLLAAGKTIADITSENYYPSLTEDDVRACIAFASHIIKDDQFVPVS